MVKLLFLDVDGTLTDGRINISERGELFKSFHVRDGYGIHDILPAYGIMPVIITGRISVTMEQRARELGIKHLYQNVKDKAACAIEVATSFGVPMEQTACMGDDLNDLPMMKICGLSACPEDAAKEVKAQCSYICRLPGGYGAVREFIEWLRDSGEL